MRIKIRLKKLMKKNIKGQKNHEKGKEMAIKQR